MTIGEKAMAGDMKAIRMLNRRTRPLFCIDMTRTCFWFANYSRRWVGWKSNGKVGMIQFGPFCISMSLPWRIYW